MKAIEPGVLYLLEDFTGGTTQTVRFTSKKSKVFHNGTTVEEVVAMLIDKLYEFQKRAPSEHNQDSITHLRAVQSNMRARLSEKKNAAPATTGQ
jgi:hypothetical protein